MDLEVVLVAAIFRPRIERRGIDGQLPVRIEHLDRAEMLGGRGVVEQDQVPDSLLTLLISGITRLLATARSDRS